MYNRERPVPVVMSFSATDPSGGAGIHADIEALGSMGCHCAPIVSAITAQDTTNLYQFYPCPSRLVRDQARAVLEDIPISGFKVGILGSIENVRATHQLLKDYPEIPVVFDPSIQIGPKAKLIDDAVQEALIALILPLVTICTVNITEARMMSPGADTLDACAQEIMAHGAEYVLVTGSYQIPNKVTNTFYGNYRRLEIFHLDRLDHGYQGSGCTLSASITGLLAQGLLPLSAIREAQEYTAACLQHGFRIGMGQHLPNRLYWSRETAFEYDFQSDTEKKKQSQGD